MTTEPEEAALIEARAREIERLVTGVDALRDALAEFHREFANHVIEERVAIEVAKLMGDTDHARRRIAFLDGMIEKAARWEQLRRKMIERGFLAGVAIFAAWILGNAGQTALNIIKIFASKS